MYTQDDAVQEETLSFSHSQLGLSIENISKKIKMLSFSFQGITQINKPIQ